MKQLLPFLLLILTPFLLDAQAVRKVLVESFTNASCPPCASQNPAFNNLIQNNADKTVLLKYQVDFPGFDPMYEQNPSEVDTRRSYYSVTSVPNVRLDGIQNAGTSGSVTQAMINNRANQSTPIEMELTHYITEALDSVYIQGIVRNIGDQTFNPGNVVLHTVIVEKRILYPEPPGSTNERDFKSVMRKMLPGPAGTPIDSILPGDSLVFSFVEPIPSYIYSVGQLGVVAFVQRTTNRQVYQAEESLPQPVPGNVVDVSVDPNAIGPDGLCTYFLTPRVDIKNEGHTTVTSMTISYTLDGGDPVTEAWEGTLESGQTLTYAFPEIPITPGASTLNYTVADKNGDAFDYNALNESGSQEILYTLSDVAVGVEISEDIEAVPVEGIPANTLVIKNAVDHFMAVNRNVFNVSQQIGGFAASAKSMFTNFYSWNDPGAEAHMIFEKIDLSDRTNNYLKFDYAHAQYQTSNDRLRISVSTDCGDTWTTLWNKAGSQLATRPATNAFFVPVAGNWRTDSISLSAFDGLNDVNVRFTVATDWGNNLFIDNIQVYQLMTSGVDEPGQLSGKVKVYPNPASEMTRIDLELEAASPVSISVFDLSGKLVENIANGNQLGAGSHYFNWTPKAQGVFLVRVATAFGAVTERVTVVK